MVGGRREVLELRGGGRARDGRGEVRVRAKDKEARLDRRRILMWDLWEVAVGI